jgi:hypothetical protein
MTAVGDLASQPAKTDDYWIAFDRTRSLDCWALPFPNGCLLAFTVQILQTGADSPEIVGCSGLSHYSPSSGSSSVPVPRPLPGSCSGSR